MKSNPLVSILTTVFNREKYLIDCIESVLASTFKDWEMIIVDDQSTDNSSVIARTYEKNDSRIKVFVNEFNLGDYANRNRASSYANGKYIKFLDADDLIYPHGLELMVKTMEQFPEAALGISQEVAEDLIPYPFVMSPQITLRREFLQRGVLGFGPTGSIIKREAFELVGRFTGTRYIGDTELWYKLAIKYPVVKMVPGLTFWRQHEDQEFTKGQNSFFYLENAFKHELKTLKHPEIPLDAQECQRALEKVNRKFSRGIIHLVKKGRFKTANRIRKNCNISWLKIFQSI